MNNSATTQSPAGGAADYRVLARKYRPQSFDDLIGQDALVRTLANALEQGRLAHAFVLTGVRGVGKTTTARIIAKGLNCIGVDGKGGPTVNPCGVCDNCRSITEDRHVDVMEMDAASRTGVDDIREIIDGVRYRPVVARYKVYIIDEVHMLSRNAFNALLKTLEEPPDHVKFVFATTEIRKVPITVLSRCQRFDLRRIGIDDLIGLFTSICAKEGVEAEKEALRLVARAADGSARDGLSLLDQAMALATGPIAPTLVQEMLGLADRAEIMDLFEDLMGGKLPEVLARVNTMHDLGADPLVIAQDLMETTHLVTRFKVAPGSAGRDVSEIERTRGGALAEALGTPHLGRAWQMFLKGITEIQQAPSPLAALEMVLIRLAHLSDLPSPANAIKTLQSSGTIAVAGALFAAKREAVLHAKLVQAVRPVRVELGILEITGDREVNEALAGALGKMLIEWTGRPWSVTLSQDAGGPTLLQSKDAAEAQIREEASTDPVVAAVLRRFPGASVEAVRPLVPPDIGEAETLVDPSTEEEDDDDDMEVRVNEG